MLGDRHPLDMTPEERRAEGLRRGYAARMLEQFVEIGGFEEGKPIDDVAHPDSATGRQRAARSRSRSPAIRPSRGAQGILGKRNVAETGRDGKS